MSVEMDPRFRFENYIVGAANRLAVSAAHAVAQAPGAAYNPLYIYSGSGLGKTHLLCAIGHLARQIQPELSVAYITVDELVDELNAAVASGAMEAFKARWQGVRVLLVDDVQFLAGRHETQSEMLRLFNTLQRAGGQVVFTSDRPPSEIADLDQRLITRFSGGLVVDVGAPDFETRVAILRLRCEERKVEFAPGVLDAVARVDFPNVRELQGALNRLIAYQTLGESSVTAENVRGLLVGDPAGNGRAPSRTPNGGEFASLVSGLSEVVAQHLETWRVRLVEALSYWREVGYACGPLERALEGSEEPDVDALLRQQDGAVARLQELEAEAERHDPSLTGCDVFRDPERLGEAELVVARLLGAAEPPPGPSPEFARADFEVGPSNQLAVHAADTVVEEPGGKYNPLVVHGPGGVGKTHLLHALGNELMAMRGGASTVACVSAEQFTEELIAALREGTIERWRARYRVVDALILDDVHRCAGTERTQEELFHLFNALYAAGRQIVLSTDRPPRDIEGLEERLRSRFEGGLVVGIEPPDLVLRQRLFARHLAAHEQRHDRELVDYLASVPVESVAEVGALVDRLVQAAAVVGVPLNAAFARKELEGRAITAAAMAVPRDEGESVFLDPEKIVWQWPDVSGRAIEEYR